MVGRDLKPGDRVRFVGYEGRDYGKGELVSGTITEFVPDHGGYMVLPDGYDSAGGFGYSELEQIHEDHPNFEPPPLIVRQTCWERLGRLNFG